MQKKESKYKMKYNYYLVATLLLIFSQSILAQEYIFEEAPKWVKEIDIPTESSVSKYDILAGYYFTLADYQINLEEEAAFNRNVINVITYSGITNASQLSVTYDTTYQELYIHHLVIWRKGKKLDRTEDLSFEIINNESSLQQGIYTGQVTAYDILNDIRKGDLIDFAYTLVGDNPIFDSEKYLFIPLEMMNPIDLVSIRILYRREKEYFYECVDCDSLNYTTSIIGDYNLIEFTKMNTEAIQIEDYTPSWSIPYKYFTLSSFNSWGEVNRWAQKIFTLNEEPELDIVFQEIFTGEETVDDKINKIIDYVQDEIRYMGIESGIGSIKPFPPEQVVSQRFGDCKDKSLLLVSLLKKIGITKVYPTLVNVIMQQDIDKLYPSNQVFNHVIVRYEYNDSIHWVDPSIAQQGGDFRDLYNFDYGKVLIIGLSGDSLHDMHPRKTKLGAYIVEEFTINSFTEPSEVIITSNRFGYDADQKRAVMEYFTAKDITDRVAKDLKLIFPIVNKKKDIVINDDMERNNFSMTYYYEIDDFWIDKDIGTEENPIPIRIFKFTPTIIQQYLSETVCDDNRKFDYMLNHPTELNYRVIFHFPQDLIIDDDLDEFDNEAFYYAEKVEQISSNSFQVDYTLKTKAKYIKVENYKDTCEQMNMIAKELGLVIYFYK